jgi:hypothetical protein
MYNGIPAIIAMGLVDYITRTIIHKRSEDGKHQRIPPPKVGLQQI